MTKGLTAWKWFAVCTGCLYVGVASAQEASPVAPPPPVPPPAPATPKVTAPERELTMEEKVAAMQASQAEMAANLAAVQEKLAAAEADKQTIETLNQQVVDLSKKLDEATAANIAANEEMKQEIASFAPSKGFKITGPGDSYLTIGGLLQTRIETTKDGTPNGSSWDWDSYLRRIRLMAYGQINKWINFFIETDNPNLGKKGSWSGAMFIQDAYMEINLARAFQIDLGMLLPPFSHHGMQAATSLLGMDYHSGLIKYPVGSNLVWRDAGLMVRGLFAGDHVEYRLAVLNGVRGAAAEGDRNPEDLPRLTMRWTFNVFDAEGGPGVGGMFYDGLYLTKTDDGIASAKRVLSFGISGDWQRDLNVTLDPVSGSVVSRDDYAAAAWDVFFDIPVGDRKLVSINGQVNGYFYYYGDRTARINEISYYDVNSDTGSYTGVGISSELGVRWNWLQPVIIADFYKSLLSEADLGDYKAFYGGFNAYVFGHATTFKLQGGAENRNGATDWSPSVRLQAQLVF